MGASAGGRRVLGLGLVFGGLLVIVGYTVATLLELQAIERAFGELATGAGREAMLPRLVLVDLLGLVAVVCGVVLLFAGRRRPGRAGAPAIRMIGPRDDEDIATASSLVLTAYRDLLGDDLSDEYAATVADVADRTVHAAVLVAVEEGRMLGCITYVDGQGRYAEWEDTDAAGIRMLAVDPAAQGRGIGTQLVRACIDLARAAGRARVVLHSTEPMRAAQRLYEREGFVRTPQRDVQIRPDLLLMAYELAL